MDSRTPPQQKLWMTAEHNDRELARNSAGVPIQCQFCIGQNFRRSRLRGADLRQLLLMRYPVRCTRCSQRQTVSFAVAGASIPSYIRHRQRSGRSRSSSTSSVSSSSTSPASQSRADAAPKT